jgi:hypothetical protein
MLPVEPSMLLRCENASGLAYLVLLILFQSCVFPIGSANFSITHQIAQVILRLGD